jgi:hypothetical protein
MAQEEAILAAWPYAGCQAAQLRQRCPEHSDCWEVLLILQQVHQQHCIVVCPLWVWLPPRAAASMSEHILSMAEQVGRNHVHQDFCNGAVDRVNLLRIGRDLRL